MEKAIPSEKQLRFLDWELGAFFHFGLRAYYKGYVDWDKRDMDQSVFNSTELNCEEWLQPFKDAGAGSTIGHKCICTFPTVKTKNIRIRVIDTNGAYTLKSLNAYYIQ